MCSSEQKNKYFNCHVLIEEIIELKRYSCGGKTFCCDFIYIKEDLIKYLEFLSFKYSRDNYDCNNRCEVDFERLIKLVREIGSCCKNNKCLPQCMENCQKLFLFIYDDLIFALDKYCYEEECKERCKCMERCEETDNCERNMRYCNCDCGKNREYEPKHNNTEYESRRSNREYCNCNCNCNSRYEERNTSQNSFECSKCNSECSKCNSE